MTSPWRTLIPALALCCALPAVAAREFTPQAGLWMIPSENNGQPGRGFSLDVQGNTAFLQVFNYEKSGAATFHTAVGQLDDAATMTVPLLRFKGGRSFGGPAQDAIADGTAGNVTVKFADGLNGTVQFPGESEQPISRFLIDQKLPFWWTQASDAPPTGDRGGMVFHWSANGADGSRKTWTAYLERDASGALSLDVRPEIRSETHYNFNSSHEWKCALESSAQIIDCSTSSPSDAESKGIARVRFRVLGRDVVGVIQPSLNSAQRISFNGWTKGSYSCKEQCHREQFRTARTYTTSEYESESEAYCVLSWCTGYGYVMMQPTSGAWVIEDENTGRPGRGVFLDVQDDTVVMQTSDYLANGEPTFHMGSGTLKTSTTLYGDTTLSMPLVRYAGGRYFGGPEQSGHEAATAGMASLSFSLRTGGVPNDMATGRITLPGEGAKTIRRLAFHAPGDGIENMLGEYFIRWNSAQPSNQGWVQLTRVEGRVAMNADGSVQCSQDSPRLKPYSMRCTLLDTANPGQSAKGTIHISANPFHRDVAFDFNTSYLRTRDQFGHWLGLGDVNLPGLAIPQNSQ